MTHMDENAFCPNCGQEMQRQLHSQYGINMGPVPTGGYYDETLEKGFSTNAERKAEMARQGVVEHGATPKEGQAWV